MKKPIVIVGHMGSGKTTISKKLAGKLGWEFVDSDQEIVAEHGAIKDIFDMHGEPHFREIERNTISGLLSYETPRVVGVGGGAFIQDSTRALIKEKALSVYLKATLPTLLARVGDGDGRPMLKAKATPEMAFIDLMKVRDPLYAQADVVVETKDEPEEETLNRVIYALEQHCRPS